MKMLRNGRKLSSWVSRSRNIIMLVTAFGFIFLFITISDSPEMITLLFVTKKVHNNMSPKTQNHDEKYFVKTNACIIPAMQPLNKNVKDFVFRPTNFRRCPQAPHSLLTHNKTHIWMTENVRTLKHYKVINQTSLECCYSSFYRPDFIENINSNNVDNRIKYNKCRYFKKVIAIEPSDEFVRVGCKTNIYEEIYNRYFIFAAEKKLIFYDDAKPITRDKTAFNVLILGIDNVSRLNFHRTMPQTAAFLKKRGGVELLGYNKVGDNTFPNVVPLLMGHDHRELKKTCHPTPGTTFDGCPFIWHWYKEAGYYTAFGEDSSLLSIFNYFLDGFCKTPTDYYIHPFVLEAQNRAKEVNHDNTWLCINELYLYQIFLNYIKDLTETLRSSRMFGFFWEVTVSHDDHNFPMFLDKSYIQLLKRLESSEYLSNTVLLLISDHGIRWGPIRNTRQGYYEERLPLAYFLMPEIFKKTYSKAFRNLKYNSRHLTTPFDVHELLLDLIDVQNFVDDKINQRSKTAYADKRGISLFLPLYGNRTCKTAGIDDHWCSCHQGIPISKESEEAVSAGKYLVLSLNALLIDHPECEELSVAEIMKAEQLKVKMSDKMKLNGKEFSVTVKVNPSGGIFEGTIRDDWKVVGTVSRLNMYGNQSSCVRSPQLKLYCYCKPNVNKVDMFSSNEFESTWL